MRLVTKAPEIPPLAKSDTWSSHSLAQDVDFAFSPFGGENGRSAFVIPDKQARERLRRSGIHSDEDDRKSVRPVPGQERVTEWIPDNPSR